MSFWDICVYEMLRFRSKHRPLLVKKKNPKKQGPDVLNTILPFQFVVFCSFSWGDGGCSECSRILNHVQNSVRRKWVASKGNNGGRVKERLTRWMWVKTAVVGQHSHIEPTPWILINGQLMARFPVCASVRVCVQGIKANRSLITTEAQLWRNKS